MSKWRGGRNNKGSGNLSDLQVMAEAAFERKMAAEFARSSDNEIKVDFEVMAEEMRSDMDKTVQKVEARHTPTKIRAEMKDVEAEIKDIVEGVPQWIKDIRNLPGPT